jgi:hypothetical protein
MKLKRGGVCACSDGTGASAPTAKVEIASNSETKMIATLVTKREGRMASLIPLYLPDGIAMPEYIRCISF